MMNAIMLAQMLSDMGSNGDTILAHINPDEARLLKRRGGSGTINPRTGLLQFESEGSNDAGATGDDGNGGNSGSSESDGGYGGYGDYGGHEDTFGVGDIAAEAAVNGTFGDYGFGQDANVNTISGNINALGIIPGIQNYVTTGLGKFTQDPYGYIGNLAYNAAPFAAGMVAGPLGYSAASAAQGNYAQAGLGFGSTFGSFAGPIGMGLGGALGYGIGYMADQYGLSSPKDDETKDSTNPGNDYQSLAQNMVSGPTGVSTAQTVSQPASTPDFDRTAFSQYGQGLINAQGRDASSGLRTSSAARGMGQDSGQMLGQIAIANQARQQKLAQFNQLMSDPNMGYNDLAGSLMNILS